MERLSERGMVGEDGGEDGFGHYPADSCEERLRESKNAIGSVKDWNLMKTLTNPFERIFMHKRECVYNGQGKTKPPVSRAFYKLWEIMHALEGRHFGFLKGSGALSFAFLAEAPGGFVESVVTARRKSAPAFCGKDTHYGISLFCPTRHAVPVWRLGSAWMESNRVRLSTGTRADGNLDDRENVESFISVCGGDGSCDMVTGDGGVDFSSNFNEQENTMQRLIAIELYVALRLLKDGGSFVIKIFDFFSLETKKLFACVKQAFDEVTICKPKSSRPANSEKYLVASKPNRNRLKVISCLHRHIYLDEAIVFNEEETIGNDLVCFGVIAAKFAAAQISNITATLQLSGASLDRETLRRLCREQNENAKAWWRRFPPGESFARFSRLEGARELDLPQRRHFVPDNQRVRVLEENLHRVAQVCAPCEGGEVL